MILTWFRDGDNCSGLPLGREVARDPDAVKDVLQDQKCFFGEVFQDDVVDTIWSRGSWLSLLNGPPQVPEFERLVVHLSVIRLKIELCLLSLLFDTPESLRIVC